LEKDPANLLLSRFPRRRLEGEAIRDAMLAAAGRLNSHQGGPGVRPPLPEELVGTLLRNHWEVSPREADHWRRSIYIFARRNLRYPIFEAFDRPDANASCPAREQSTTAPQSLLMFNSEFSLDVARRLAGRVLAEGSHAGEHVRLCFEHTLSRAPTSRETEAAAAFLAKQAALIRGETQDRTQLALPSPMREDADPYAAAALTDFCLALLNVSEFVYVD
jgi:hypothetical protein